MKFGDDEEKNSVFSPFLYFYRSIVLRLQVLKFQPVKTFLKYRALTKIKNFGVFVNSMSSKEVQ